MELAVFLLAGRGSRLNRYTEIIPKCLVEVSGKPILHRMLEILLKKGIKKAIFVVGYKWENIFESVGENWKGIEIQYVNNTDWAKTNNIVSFYMAKDAIGEDFLLIEGDIIIAQNALEPFRSGQNQMAVSLFEPFMDGTVVSINKNHKIERIYLKSDINSSINLAETFKTVNIYGLKNDDFQKFVVPAFKDIIDSGKVNSYYEQAFAQLVNSGLIKFDAVDYSNLKWYEVDNEQDLEEAERIFSK
jgi:choline kinase